MTYKLIANSNYILKTDNEGIVYTIPDDPRNYDCQ